MSSNDETRPLLGEDQPSRPSFVQRFKRNVRKTFGPLSDPESLRPLERFLLFLALVLLLTSAVLGGLYAGARHRRSSHGWVPGWPGDDKGGDEPKELPCLTPECVETASEYIRAINPAADPCDDFYEFSTGGWREAHPIPEDAGLFGIAQYIANVNAKVIIKLLEDAPAPTEFKQLALASSSSKDSQDKIDERNLAKLRSFYESCKDTRAQDAAGAKPVLDIVADLRSRLHGARKAAGEYGGAPVPPNKPPGRDPVEHPGSEHKKPLPPQGGRQKAFTDALAWAHAHGIPVFFSWMIEGEPVKDPKLATPYLQPDGLGFPDKSYYEDKDELAFYRRSVTAALLELDAAEEAAKREKEHKGKHHFDEESNKKEKKESTKQREKRIAALAHYVVELETALAGITPEGEDLADPLGSYNPVSLASLSYSLTAVDWAHYLKVLAAPQPKSFILLAPKFVPALDSLISRTRDDVLEAYFAWTALRTLGLALGPSVPLRKSVDALDRHITGVDADAPVDRTTLCLGNLNAALGFMAGRYFVRDSFPQQAKDKTELIMRNIVSAFKDRLPELDWLDPATRRKAEKKADSVRATVGWPESPKTTDAGSVEAFYAELKITKDDYFGNMLRSSKSAVTRDWKDVGGALDTERWDMFPAEVNAEYSPLRNAVIIPAGEAQKPYFSYKWADYLQYGVFGSVAGHELSHAFDPDGRLYDETGHLHDWWTNDTAAAFNERRDCIIEQYGNYTVPDGRGGQLNLRSRLSVGEDVADAGGLAQSWRAWQTSLKQEDAPKRNLLLPGLNYTREQLFFMAYGLGWARSIRQGEQMRRLKTDPHSPTRFRVIGPLSNMPQFAEAFGCSSKDRMVRSEKERCSIW